MTVLLGLDLASRLTGWCCGDGAQDPALGVWEFPNIRDADGEYDYGLLLATLEDYLGAAFARFSPGAVAYEAPLLITAGRRGVDLQARSFGDNLSKLRLLYPLGAFVEWYCHRRGVPCHEVTVPEVKAEVTNDRHADKETIAQVAEGCGLVLPTGPGRLDAADAFAVWKRLLRSYNAARSAEWDTRIQASKGGLL